MVKFPLRAIPGLFLLIILVLSVYTVVVILDEDVHARFAHSIDIMGRQRMLTQHVEKLVYQLQRCEISSCDPKVKSGLTDRIRATENLFRQSSIFLVSGRQGDQDLVKLYLLKL